MTNVLTGMKDFIETEKVEVDYSTPKLDMIFDFLLLKSFAKKSKSKINECIERNKEIRNGKTVLTGTRITTKEIVSIIIENKNKKNVFEYICEQYPSIDDEKKIFYGALYEITKKNTIVFILEVALAKQ